MVEGNVGPQLQANGGAKRSFATGHGLGFTAWPRLNLLAAPKG